MSKLDNIFQTLGINTDNGLYYTNDAKWKTELRFPSRVNRFLEQTEPVAFFCLDNKPMILFFETPNNKRKLHKDIWNLNESPIVIIVENNNVEIFNGFKLIEKGEDKNILTKIGDENRLNDFTYFKLVTGETWETYQNELSYKNRVDYKLLINIKDARNEIIDFFPNTNDEDIKKQNTKITNALLGKIIFVRYLIDREVILNFENVSETWTDEKFCDLLRNPKKTKEFFDYLADREQGFNGDLFPITEKEYSTVPNKAYEVLIRLLKSQEIKTGQLSLFNLYDFSIIPTEFISNVYESFVGIEKKETKKEKKDDDGVHYTPLFLVDYILSETVEKFITQNKSYNCKVLDPSCGSGVFLVEILRKLIEQYKENNPQVFENDKEKFKEDIKKIAIENIFGVDKDESAIQVAIFSIYLTLLSEMNPPEISTFKFPPLLDINFFCDDFFLETAKFNCVFRDENFKNFDFIIGNPPWFRGKNEKKKTKQEPLYVQYINKRKKKEGIPQSTNLIGNKEIAQAFLLRSSDFSKENTKCALVVTSKVLYNLQSKDFRRYFLHNYFIEKVFELAPVRREVFDKSNDKAIAPACVLFFSYAHGQNTDTNPIEHIALKPSRFFSMFKIFTINRHDIQTVQQDRLKEYDWLWKVLVYGSYLDFNFIKRLKEDYPTIQNSFDENTLIKQGLKRIDGDKKIDVTSLIGWDFLDLNKKEIQQFFIKEPHNKWNLKEVGYIYRENGRICEDMFSPPMLLIKETVNTHLESVSAISQKKVLFTDKITSIKFRNNQTIDDYYLIAGLINSTLFAYYMLNASSTAGIMIEQQINDVERFSFPYIHSKKIIEKAKKIELLKNNTDPILLAKQQSEISNLSTKINESVYKVFSLTEIENALVDYGKNIAIPLMMRHKNYEKLFLPLKLKDSILDDYANLFIKRFSSNFEKIGKKFVVEVWHTKQIVGMFFKIVSQNEYNKPIVWENKQQDTAGVFNKIIELGTTKITDQLFVQKDIRGFEKESFYIFKPNEKRLWHKAIGYLDVEEFADAILKAGRDIK